MIALDKPSACLALGGAPRQAARDFDAGRRYEGYASGGPRAGGRAPMSAEHEASGSKRDRWKRALTRSHRAVHAANPYVELLAGIAALVALLR